MKRFLKILLAMTLVLIFTCGAVVAEGNVRYPDEVTAQMTNPEYWITLREIPDYVLLDLNSIQKINDQIAADCAVNHVIDLEKVIELHSNGIETFDRELYLDGEPIDEAEIIEEMEQGRTELSELLYAVTVKRANLRGWPTNEYLGYTPDDPDDELQNSILEVNYPVVISEKCVFHNHLFYFCQSEYLTGWIDSNELAICKDREEWLDSWKVDINGKDFLIVLQDKIILEPMLYEPEISEVELKTGTVLKLVPENEIPERIGEREGTYFNYVVYLPTRNEEGRYIRKIALVPARSYVSIGYLPFTEANITRIAFEHLGNRYGWGGMMRSYDSSLFNRQVYRCFGFKLPTNTTWQKSISGYAVDLSEMSEEEKLEYVKRLPLGAILYIKGCSLQYIGCIGDTPYVISSIGVYSNSQGEVDSRRHYTVSVIPMTARRRDGETFMSSLNYVLRFK